MNINGDSITRKVKAFAKSEQGKKMMDEKITEYIKKDKKQTHGGTRLITKSEMQRYADDLVNLIRQRALSYASVSGDPDGIPPSVIAHFSSLRHIKPTRVDDRTFKVTFRFEDDLSRPSLDPGMYDGIKNIVALFDTGYYARESVYGWWDSHSQYTWSRTDREGLHFMQEAVDEFNQTYSQKNGPNVTLSVELSDEYSSR